MKNYDYWNSFVNSGRIDDYLNYIACTREEGMEDFVPDTDNIPRAVEKNKEGGVVAGINYRDGNGSFSHAGW